MDQLIENLNKVLSGRGYPQLPLELYKFYKKSDQDILEELKAENVVIREIKESIQENPELEDINPNIGTKMVIDHYFR